MITIIDYKTGNTRSIRNALAYLGYQSKISDQKEDIQNASILFLPGVGSFDSGMSNLKSLGLTTPITEHALIKKKPIIGICLGMQLLTSSSEEGTLDGLKIIDAHVKKFRPKSHTAKVPHMGWNKIQKRKSSSVIEKLPPHSKFYFVHSYYVVCNTPTVELTSTTYDIPFTSSFQKENIWGFQIGRAHV